ncbi:MAG TPA: MFS transporter, partial [Jatrophihabitans sp.]
MRRLVPDSAGGRLFTTLSFVDAFGTGVFLAAGAFFFVRSIGLSTGQIGTGLAVAGLVGLAASVPMGSLADRVGVRRLMVTVQFWRAACFLAYAGARSMTQFVVIASFAAVAQSVSGALSTALVPAIVGEQHRVRTMALVRTVRNIGFSAGALVSAPLIALNSRPAMQAVVLLNAASFLGAGILLARVQLIPGAGRPHREASPLAALAQFRNWRYATVAALNIVFSVHFTLLMTVIPLWVLTATTAPAAIVSVLLLVNTAMAVLLQIPLSRGSENVGGSVRLITFAGLALAACCLFMAAAGGMPTAAAVFLLVAGMVAMTLGEIWQSAGTWTVSYRFAPPDHRAQYLTIFNLSGLLAQEVLGPFLLVGVMIGLGRTG